MAKGVRVWNGGAGDRAITKREMAAIRRELYQLAPTNGGLSEPSVGVPHAFFAFDDDSAGYDAMVPSTSEFDGFCNSAL